VYYLKFFSLILVWAWLLPFSGLYSQERKIKPGDAIEIVVYEHQELNHTVVVGPDGTVDSPFLKKIPVDDITLERFQEILVSQLSRYMERSPVLQVCFAESYPIKVTVLGQVVKPGVYMVQNIATIQGAIGEAGGAVTGAQLSQVKLIRAMHQEMSAPTMDNGVGTQVVNMERFYLRATTIFRLKMVTPSWCLVPGDHFRQGWAGIGPARTMCSGESVGCHLSGRRTNFGSESWQGQTYFPSRAKLS
jgi:protein involved in polysaccharide export with SLBB domain